MKIFVSYLILSLETIAIVFLLGMLGAAIWYGFSVEIGKPSDGFHFRYYVLPLRRFF